MSEISYREKAGAFALWALLAMLFVTSAFAQSVPTWTEYSVGGLTLIIGSKAQNKKFFSELGSSTIIGIHPRGSLVYVATPNPGVILHEFAHTINPKGWPVHKQVPYRVREIGARELREIVGFLPLEPERGEE
jgi:hypothetical protein